MVSWVKPYIQMCSQGDERYLLNLQFYNSAFSVGLFWRFCLKRISGDKCFEIFLTVAPLFCHFWSQCLQFKSNLHFSSKLLACVCGALRRNFPHCWLCWLSPLNWNLSDVQSCSALCSQMIPSQMENTVSRWMWSQILIFLFTAHAFTPVQLTCLII